MVEITKQHKKELLVVKFHKFSIENCINDYADALMDVEFLDVVGYSILFSISVLMQNYVYI